jgi:hypothetical protein
MAALSALPVIILVWPRTPFHPHLTHTPHPAAACPGTPACSGHGRCLSLKQLASEAAAAPFGGSYSYGGDPWGATWDEDKVHACVCDSEWAVGYGPGQTQATQYYGPDCSLKRCPSGDDPRTAGVDETDCEWADAVRKGEVMARSGG